MGALFESLLAKAFAGELWVSAGLPPNLTHDAIVRGGCANRPEVVAGGLEFNGLPDERGNVLARPQGLAHRNLITQQQAGAQAASGGIAWLQPTRADTG